MGYGPSDATRALRAGRSGEAIKLAERIALPLPGDRWLPVAGGTALELVDKRGHPRGWVYARKEHLRDLLTGNDVMQGSRGAEETRTVATTSTIKRLDGDRLRVLAIPYGVDLEGERFSERTDLRLDWFKERPLLFDHGRDAGPGGPALEPIGWVDSTTITKAVDGVWVTAVLERRSRYLDSVRELLRRDALGASSGALGYQVRKAEDGHIDVWPWVELSLTPGPANPAAVVTLEAAQAHFRAAGLALPPCLEGAGGYTTPTTRGAVDSLEQLQLKAIKLELEEERRREREREERRHLDTLTRLL